MSTTRTFQTGATRDQDTSKHDYEGFLSPRVLEAFGAYMHFNREMADGSLRDSDNWQKGIPRDAYMKSMWRHFMDAWMEHRGIPTKEGLILSLCAILFNAMGYLHEVLSKNPGLLEVEIEKAAERREKMRRKAAARRLLASDVPIVPTIITNTQVGPEFPRAGSFGG